MSNHVLGLKKAVILAGLAISAVMAATAAAETGWPQVGGDPGMTKYSPENISAGELQQVYVKRFYGAWADKLSPVPNYHYGSAVVIQNGTAAVFSNDEPKEYAFWTDGIALTLFKWSDGKTTDKNIAPGGSVWKNNSFHIGQHAGEIDSHHYSTSVLWGDDGRFYARRGGDHFCVAAYDPATRKWLHVELLTTSPNFKHPKEWGGNTGALLNRWGGLLVYRPGETRFTAPYVAADISPAAWKDGKPGAWKMDLGPFISSKSDRNGLRYCDYPKISPAGIAVVAGQITSDSGQWMCLQATNLADGKRLWDSQFDDPGRADFGASAAAYWWFGPPNSGFSCYNNPIGRTSDYWRFIATDSLYLFYNGKPAQTLQALDIKDGNLKWKYDLGEDHPILACHGDFLYVIGDSKQMKLDIKHGGKAVWTTENHFAGDAGYVMGGEDPVYRPMVLTDDTLWFIDGSSISDHHKLIGMKTSDGTVVQTIDLAALAAKNAGESLLAVNDLVASQGKLGVLIGIQSKDDPHAAEKCNHIIHQDLYVFSKP